MRKILLAVMLLCFCGCEEERKIFPPPTPPDQAVTSASVSVVRRAPNNGGTWTITLTAEIAADTRADAVEKAAAVLLTHATPLMPKEAKSQTKAEKDDAR